MRSEGKRRRIKSVFFPGIKSVFFPEWRFFSGAWAEMRPRSRTKFGLWASGRGLSGTHKSKAFFFRNGGFLRGVGGDAATEPHEIRFVGIRERGLSGTHMDLNAAVEAGSA